ncbi:MAG: ClpXP protease specificity-enhancing factor [Proteobacteria bacterium]|nr:ClpXP protease specificity-enhancing factor [Pseudomonadota bacterium]
MTSDPNMTSMKPYVVRAIHQWISDNGLTALMVLDSEYEGIRVPAGIAENKKIVFNISTAATQNLEMDNEFISFNARFSGISQAIIVPLGAITAIYAKENGKGMVFEVDKEDYDHLPESDRSAEEKRSHLKLLE